MSDLLTDIIYQIKSYYKELKRNGVKSVFLRDAIAGGIDPEKIPLKSKAVLETKNLKSAHNNIITGVRLSPDKNSSNTADSQDKNYLLNIVKDDALGCVKCNELVGNRSKVVFGTGNPNTKLMFVGEAPGHDEDVQGVPFVGKAGQLLTKIIKSIGFDRNDVYIANVLKCRPPDNRNPMPDEIRNCETYLMRQIEIIQPKVICALGTFAAKSLLNTEQNISSLRGKRLDFKGFILIPTYHPSYLLRSPQMKKEVWKDMLEVKKAVSE